MGFNAGPAHYSTLETGGFGAAAVLKVLPRFGYPVAPLHCFLEPVAFIVIIADDEMQPAVQVEGAPSRIARVLEHEVFLFRTGQHEDDILVRPGFGQTCADELPEQTGLLQGKQGPEFFLLEEAPAAPGLETLKGVGDLVCIQLHRVRVRWRHVLFGLVLVGKAYVQVIAGSPQDLIVCAEVGQQISPDNACVQQQEQVQEAGFCKCLRRHQKATGLLEGFTPLPKMKHYTRIKCCALGIYPESIVGFLPVKPSNRPSIRAILSLNSAMWLSIFDNLGMMSPTNARPTPIMLYISGLIFLSPYLRPTLW